MSGKRMDGQEFRRWFAGVFGVVLVVVGGLGLIAPDLGSTSTAPAYDTIHVANGLLVIALAVRGRPVGIRAFLVGFGAIDLYQAVASHWHWFPESLFRWTSTDDFLHVALGVLLVVVGAWPVRRTAV